jgi:Bacterial antitoxin of type II TA system, VapB
MKTTIDISDPLLDQAKRLAHRQGTTVRALVEQGLRLVVAEKSRSAGFKFEAVTDGRGPTPHEALPWEQVRDIIYEGRGA